MKHIGLFVNTTKPDAITCTERAVVLLKKAGMDCCAAPGVVKQLKPEVASVVKSLSYNDFDKFADIIVSFGGDGTMLAAAQQFIASELPIMGVNLGKLGFLAEFGVDELENAFAALQTGAYLLENRTVLETIVHDTTMYALNDIVVHKKDFSRMITIKASADGRTIAEYHADGLIISTPTGSTAYSLASGGPIVEPGCGIVIITPVSPHTLTMRPLVISDSREILLETGIVSGTTSLVADGQTVKVLDAGAKVIIRKSERVVKLLKRSQHNYYDLLKKKLLWSIHAKQ
jgi:NAD+ kinase